MHKGGASEGLGGKARSFPTYFSARHQKMQCNGELMQRGQADINQEGNYRRVRSLVTLRELGP